MRLSILFILLFISVYCPAQNDSIIKRGKKYFYKGDEHLFNRRYDSIREFSEGRAAVMKNGKWGYINRKGEQVIVAQYDGATDFHGGLAAVQLTGEYLWRIIQPDGFVFQLYGYRSIISSDSLTFGIFSSVYSEDKDIDVWKYPGRRLLTDIDSFLIREHGILVYDGGLRRNLQVITKRGAIITPPILAIDSMLQRTLVVTARDSFTQAVLTNDARISPFYKEIDTIGIHCYLIRLEDKYGVMDSSFGVIVPVAYSKITSHENQFLLEDDSTAILADASGNFLTPQFASLKPLSPDIFLAKGNRTDSTFLLINNAGDTLPGKFGYVFPASEGIMRVISVDYKQYSYINSRGEQIAPWFQRAVTPKERIKYHAASGPVDIPDVVRTPLALLTCFMTEILFATMEHEAYTTASPTDPICRSSGESVYETFPGYNGAYRYFYGTDFHNGITFTSIRRKQKPSPYKPLEEFVLLGAIDTAGKNVLNYEYSALFGLDSVIMFKKNTGAGLASYRGKIILQPKYDEIEPIGNGFYLVKKERGYFSPGALVRCVNDSTTFLTGFTCGKVTPADDSIFLIFSNSRYGYIDLNGKPITPIKFSQAGLFGAGRAKVEDAETREEYYINTKGERVE